MAYAHQVYWLQPESERAQDLHPLRNNAGETGATISHPQSHATSYRPDVLGRVSA